MINIFTFVIFVLFYFCALCTCLIYINLASAKFYSYGYFLTIIIFCLHGSQGYKGFSLLAVILLRMQL